MNTTTPLLSDIRSELVAAGLSLPPLYDSQTSPSTGRVWHVDQAHAQASDDNPATADKPLRSINAAAQQAQPGDTVLIHTGIYRERVSPARGGEAGAPITYAAAPGARVAVRGSEVFSPTWKQTAKDSPVWSGSLAGVTMGKAAYAGYCDPDLYGDFNPFQWNFNREVTARPHDKVVQEVAAREPALHKAAAEAQTDAQKRQAREKMEKWRAEYDKVASATRPCHRTTLSQLFIDGLPMRETEWLDELHTTPGTWMVNPQGDALLVHPPVSNKALSNRLVEISVRHTVFAPLKRGLGHITVRGLVLEHAANHFPTWGKTAWAQAGMLSCRSGHHWVIEDNIIRHAKSVGIDCGSEGGASEHKEFPGSMPSATHHDGLRDLAKVVGYHTIRHNLITDNGHCGLTGIGHYGTRVLGNVIQRNNCDGWTSPWWEFAGIKFHFFYDGLIEGNLIRDNEAHGIWIDNQWRGSRITRNVIVNNLWSGINVELGRGPVLIDHNVIALTRRGDGVYGHDCADITVAHNLIYGNANCGAWFAYATPRVKPQDGCWDIKVLNNLILGNQGGTIGLPMPWHCAGNNVSDGNLFMGGGDYLDEGSGSRPPLFILTNQTHMGQMQEFHSFPAMTPERTRELLAQNLEKAGVPKDQWPNLATWTPHGLVSFDLWKAAMGCDANSREMSAIREGLSTTRLAFQMTFDQALTEVACVPVAGVENDWDGKPMPAKGALPGPFQNLAAGYNHRLLWPVK